MDGRRDELGGDPTAGNSRSPAFADACDVGVGATDEGALDATCAGAGTDALGEIEVDACGGSTAAETAPARVSVGARGAVRATSTTRPRTPTTAASATSRAIRFWRNDASSRSLTRSTAVPKLFSEAVGSATRATRAEMCRKGRSALASASTSGKRRATSRSKQRITTASSSGGTSPRHMRSGATRSRRILAEGRCPFSTSKGGRPASRW